MHSSNKIIMISKKTRYDMVAIETNQETNKENANS